MRSRRLGKTGLEVSELSLGGVFISSAATDYAAAERTIHRALEHGINLFDAAPAYPDSEEVLGRALASAPAHDALVCTKIGNHGPDFDPMDADSLRRSVEASLRNLRREVIDIILLHEPDRDQPHAWWHDRESYEGPVLGVLDELRSTGKVRCVGLGGTTAYEMARLIRTRRFDVVLTAFQYSLLWREAEHEVIPAARELELGLMIGSPLQQGLLARSHDLSTTNRPRREQFLALYQLVDAAGIALPELALRFALQNRVASTVLTGSCSAEELEANVAAAARGPLPGDVARRVDEIAAMVPFRPYLEHPENPFLPAR